jgi:hypothetical protein
MDMSADTQSPQHVAHRWYEAPRMPSDAAAPVLPTSETDMEMFFHSLDSAGSNRARYYASQAAAQMHSPYGSTHGELLYQII